MGRAKKRKKWEFAVCATTRASVVCLVCAPLPPSELLCALWAEKKIGCGKRRGRRRKRSSSSVETAFVAKEPPPPFARGSAEERAPTFLFFLRHLITTRVEE